MVRCASYGVLTTWLSRNLCQRRSPSTFHSRPPYCRSNMLSYEQLAANTKNALTKRLLSIIVDKQTNLCVSIDVTSPDELLSIIRDVGPYVCIVKVIRVLMQANEDSHRHPHLLSTHINIRPSNFIERIQLHDLRRPQV